MISSSSLRLISQTVIAEGVPVMPGRLVHVALCVGVGAGEVLLAAFGSTFLQLGCPELHRSIRPGDAGAVS